ncbi:DUF1223 domain-containing protein [Aureimonas altamirensis]|uniref:DUF1223 domain-containing protein n=1 Tax=Aureimonas altamirensis TaxID=370622 RepID=UPI002036FD6B|nr:DUF1223 domain-containing protein [Aureimonas altamirensis]MCM2502451.1 DUF1223 domain-containing protein [Aureimonas altamirensis]
MMTTSCPSLRTLLMVAGLAGTLGPGPAMAQSASSDDFNGVVELFTSQGCASCPPADDVLARLSDQRGIVALSYNVDYWDYIGWKDQLATRQNTERQRSYAKAFRTSSVYTPQIVVNGTGDFVGSHDREISEALKTSPLATGRDALAQVGMNVVDETLQVRAKLRKPVAEHPPILVLVTYQDRIETPVLKGENSGHHIVNRHAVSDFKVVGTVSDTKPLEIDIPVSMLQEGARGPIGCAVLLQAVDASGTPGRILAAAQLEFDED